MPLVVSTVRWGALLRPDTLKLNFNYNTNLKNKIIICNNFFVFQLCHAQDLRIPYVTEDLLAACNDY